MTANKNMPPYTNKLVQLIMLPPCLNFRGASPELLDSHPPWLTILNALHSGSLDVLVGNTHTLRIRLIL